MPGTVGHPVARFLLLGSSDGVERPALDARDERREGGSGDGDHRAARDLGVTDGNDAARGGEIRGDLDAVAAVVAVRGLEPSGGFGRHRVPFRNWLILATDAVCDSDAP